MALLYKSWVLVSDKLKEVDLGRGCKCLVQIQSLSTRSKFQFLLCMDIVCQMLVGIDLPLLDLDRPGAVGLPLSKAVFLFWRGELLHFVLVENSSNGTDNSSSASAENLQNSTRLVSSDQLGLRKRSDQTMYLWIKYRRIVQTSFMVMVLSETVNSPHLEVISTMDLRVTPGKMIPLSSGGVTSSLLPSGCSRWMNMFIAPTSVISWSSPKSHKTCWQPYFSATFWEGNSRNIT